MEHTTTRELHFKNDVLGYDVTLEVKADLRLDGRGEDAYVEVMEVYHEFENEWGDGFAWELNLPEIVEEIEEDSELLAEMVLDYEIGRADYLHDTLGDR